jgi:prepilin-type processing-associated H-X9-DG protein
VSLPTHGSRVSRSARSTAFARAFSLPELIVVIGLIALLIALLLPTMARVRENAYRTKCLANLRTIGQAGMMHVNEHRGYLPCGGWHWSPIGGVLNPAGLGDSEALRFDYYQDGSERRPMPITTAFAQYMGVTIRTDSREHLEEDLQLDKLRTHWRCPSQATDATGWTQKESSGWTTPEEFTGYAFNEALLGRRQGTPEQGSSGKMWNYPMAHITDVKHPSEVFMFIDGRPRNQTDRRCPSVYEYSATDTLYDWQSRSGSELFDFFRHRHKINVLFVDGHAETDSMDDGSLQTIGVSKGMF